MRPLIILSVAFGLGAALAHGQPLLTGNDLRQLCTTEPQQCQSYIATVAELLRPSTCRSYTTAEIDAVAVTLRYLRDGGDLRNFDAVLVIQAAMEEAAGCGNWRRGPKAE